MRSTSSSSKITAMVMLAASMTIAGPQTAAAERPPAGPADSGQHGESPDFNADGFDDLAIGSPNIYDQGSVTVLYGSASGVTAVDAQRWTLADFRLAGDGFGLAVAGGDFDGDGFDDLVASDLEKRLVVVRGSAEGLTARGHYDLVSGRDGMPPPIHEKSLIGHTIVAGDFDQDGFDDVVASSIRTADPTKKVSGAVVLVRGGPSGLNPRQSRLIDLRALGEEATSGDLFGAKLAVGDPNGDGFPDLGIGVPGLDREGGRAKRDEGGAVVVFGSADGIELTGHQVWRQDTPGVIGAGRRGEDFGKGLEFADLDGDGFDELVIGAGQDRIGPRGTCGAVTVLRGTAAGLTAEGSVRWHRGTRGIAGRCHEPETDDYGFGLNVASGDIDGDGRSELLIGAPGEALPDGAGDWTFRSGGASLLQVTPDGFAIESGTWWHQGRADIPDEPQDFDEFGDSIVIGDFNGDGFGDVAIGASRERVGDRDDSGQVHVLYGTESLLTAAGTQVWHPDVPGVPGKAKWGAAFGQLPGSGE